MIFVDTVFLKCQGHGRKLIQVDYTKLVKTTITLPDTLARKAERAALRIGISRNQLFVDAISEYLDHNRTNTITKKLNEIYSRESSDLDPVLYQAQLLSLKK